VPFLAIIFAGGGAQEKSSLPAGALGRFLAGPHGNGNKDIKIPLYAYHERRQQRRRHSLSAAAREDDNDKRAVYRDFVADLKAARKASSKHGVG
jgi:hypothetical protein